MLSKKKVAQIASKVWGSCEKIEPFHGDVERFARLVEAAVLRSVARKGVAASEWAKAGVPQEPTVSMHMVIGKANAAVLPVPVCAQPNMS